MAYADVTQFRQYVPQAGSGDVAISVEATDAQITDVLERATRIVDGVSRIAFWPTSQSDWPAASAKVVWTERSVWHKLPAYQQGSIVSIVETASGQAITDWEERWEAGIYHLWREAGWAARRYTVTAKWGYGPAPADIVEVTLEVAVNLWRGRDRGMFQEVQTGPTSTGAGGGSLRFIGGLTNQQKAIIDNVRRQYRDPMC